LPTLKKIKCDFQVHAIEHNQTKISKTKKKPTNFSMFFSTFSFTKMQNIQDRQCMCTRKIEALSRNHCLCAKARSVTYSEFVFVALVIQHAKCMLRTILSAYACLSILYSSTLSHKTNDFRNNIIDRKICVSVFSTTFV
jgi:hypothetical protein